jgi:hemoglobin
MPPAPQRAGVIAALISALCLYSAGVPAATLPLYSRLGGEPVMTAVVSETIDQVVADPRLNQSFRGSNLGRIKRMLVEQICDITGGGCHYSGDSMRQVHEGHNITQAQFFGLVEILRKSLRRHHVPLRERNELLALLAPMAPDVIEVPSPPMPKRPGP